MSLRHWFQSELTAASAANRGRWPFALPVGMGIGIGAYFLMAEEPVWFAGPLVLVGAVLAAVLLRRSGGAPFFMALVLAFVALSFAAASLRTHSLDGRLLTQETPTTVIEGRIIEFEPYHQGSRVILDRVRVAALSQPATPERDPQQRTLYRAYRL